MLLVEEKLVALKGHLGKYVEAVSVRVSSENNACISI